MPPRYPLTLPDTTYRGGRLNCRSVVGVHSSEFTLRDEVQEHSGDRWEFEFDLVNRGRAAFAAWQAALLKLAGRRGTFLLGDPLANTARGAPSGTPTVNGAGQLGTDLLTQGWTPNTTGLLLPGDYVQVCRNYVTSPNDLEDAAWTPNLVTRDNNTGDVTDPLGTNTATKVTPTVGSTDSFVYQAKTAAVDYEPGFTFGANVWLRAASGTPSINFRLAGDSGLSSGNKLAETTAVLSTSWQQFNIQGTANASVDRLALVIGGAATWPEADGAVYAWGGSIYALEYDARLHQVVEQFNSDSNGRGTLSLRPKLRTIDNHARILYSSPRGLFRLRDNVVGWNEASPARYVGAQINAVEAL